MSIAIPIWQDARVFHIGDVVRKLRLQKGWSQEELAVKAGVAKGTVNDLEQDKRSFRRESLKQIAEALGGDVPGLYALLGGSAEYDSLRRRDPDEVEPGTIDVSGYTKDDVPVIAEGDATPQPNLFWSDEGKLLSDVEDRISRPHDVTDPRAYGVRVRGDSMITRLQAGDIAIISPNTPVLDGDEVYAQLLSGERLLKVAHKLPGGWLLESYNRAYEPRQVKKSEIGAMHPILWIRSRRRGERTVRIKGEG